MPASVLRYIEKYIEKHSSSKLLLLWYRGKVCNKCFIKWYFDSLIGLVLLHPLVLFPEARSISLDLSIFFTLFLCFITQPGTCQNASFQFLDKHFDIHLKRIVQCFNFIDINATTPCYQFIHFTQRFRWIHT